MMTICTALLVLGSCVAARWYLDRPARKRTTGAWFYLGGMWNEGAAFNLPIPRKPLLVLSVLALAGIWPFRGFCPLGAGLALGGGISNLWERVRHGRVFDYLHFPKAPWKWKHYVYNLADLAIFLGAMGLLIGKVGKTFCKR